MSKIWKILRYPQFVSAKHSFIKVDYLSYEKQKCWIFLGLAQITSMSCCAKNNATKYRKRTDDIHEEPQKIFKKKKLEFWNFCEIFQFHIFLGLKKFIQNNIIWKKN